MKQCFHPGTRLVLGAALLLLSLGRAQLGSPPALAQGSQILEQLELPEPRRAGSRSLEELLDQRHSVRSFEAGKALVLEELGQLFWAAQGLKRLGGRTAPSAGALYPLELYAVTRRGLYHYKPESHAVLAAWQGGMLDSVRVAAGGQRALRQAPAVFIIAAVEAKCEARYGARARRFVTLEAGHAAQNLLLQATALELGAVPIGAFDEAGVSRALALPEDQTLLYLIPVGHPLSP